MQRSFLVGLLLTAVTACNPETNKQVSAVHSTQTPAFVGKTWRMESCVLSTPVDLDKNGTPDHDLTPLLDDCHKEDLINFRSTGEVFAEHDTQRCQPEQPAISQLYTWTYQEQKQMLLLTSIDNPAEVSHWRVLQCDDNTLKLSIGLTEDTPFLRTIMTLKAVDRSLIATNRKQLPKQH